MKIITLSLIAGMTISISTVSLGDEIYSTNKRGNSLYNNKQYEEALKQYDDALLLSPSDSRLKMNKGSTHYKLDEFDKAEESYTAALSSDNKQLLADAHYNLGNIQFKQGAQLYQTAPQEAQEKFKSALNNYIQTLDIRPDDIDAKWNLQLAHHVLKQLENQDKNQDQNQKDQNNKDNQQDKQNQDNKDKQNQENKDKQDQKDQDKQKENQDDKQSQEQKQDEQKSQQDQQKNEDQQQQQSEMNEQQGKDLKKEEANRIIEMFADDADTLNKPMKNRAARIQQPQQDW